ncbi:MarR family transcriptional regulator [Hypnocyclicus thermotrophus]|uniref:HTH-type transcriptional regulator SarZ n=1 Tax=Hypnocyclicus thermotrophus TaxID=1627895 RepID=A0AA46I6I9_9FUSO|nr:MarR family transcriptional regulator [Hypnocyclicus thermotrophus]TDT72594.1 MarR family transcriptional regulator [Hypnocyclicus thermotrophus]
MEKKNYGKENSLNLKLFLILNRCTQSVNRNIYPIFKEKGITESQFYVLEFLYHKGDSRIKDIINKTFSTGGTMTVIIDNLVKQNLIEKKKDPRDRRAFLISLTLKGKEVIEKIFDKHLKNLEKIFDVLGNEEKELLKELLKKLGKYQN